MFDGLGFTEQIPPSLHDEVCIGSAITLGIRSEHLEVQDTEVARFVADRRRAALHQVAPGRAASAEGEGQQQEDRFQTEWPQAGASD